MRLTDTELDNARALIRAGDIDAMMRWVDERGIIIDKERTGALLGKVAPADPDRAIRLFDSVFVGMDPEKDKREIRIRTATGLTVFLVIVLGCAGGIAYLVRLVLG